MTMSHIGNPRPIGPRQTPPPLPRNIVLRGRSNTLIGGSVAVNGVWYKPVDLLGKGGEGSVYRAVSLGDQASYAIKVANPGESVQNEAEILRSICRIDPDDSPEAAMIKSSQAHPSIVKYVAHNRECLVMEYVPGKTLETHLKEVKRGKEPKMDLSELLRHMISICQGLAFAGCAHYDIKPLNLMLGADGNTRVLDWGASNTSAHVMTFCYCDHLQLRGHRPGWRSDQYALAITGYEWVTGVNPIVEDAEFNARCMTIISNKEDPRFPASRAFYQWMYARHLSPKLEPHEYVPDSLLGVFRRMTARNPNERYGTWEEVIGALGQVAA